MLLQAANKKELRELPYKLVINQAVIIKSYIAVKHASFLYRLETYTFESCKWARSENPSSLN